MLPGLTGELYAEAKRAYERKDYKSAESGFKTVLTLLEDPDMQGKQARTWARSPRAFST